MLFCWSSGSRSALNSIKIQATHWAHQRRHLYKVTHFLKAYLLKDIFLDIWFYIWAFFFFNLHCLPDKVFLFFIFDRTTAYGVPGPGIRSKLQLWQCQIPNPVLGQGSNLHASTPDANHSGNSKTKYFDQLFDLMNWPQKCGPDTVNNDVQPGHTVLSSAFNLHAEPEVSKMKYDVINFQLHW